MLKAEPTRSLKAKKLSGTDTCTKAAYEVIAPFGFVGSFLGGMSAVYTTG